MKYIFTILTTCVAVLQADRSNLPNLGAVRRLGVPDFETVKNFLPASLTNAKNVHVKVTTNKDSFQSESQPQQFIQTPNFPTGFSSNFNHSSEDLTFLPLNTDSGISLDSVEFFDKSLHEAGPHTPPYPIIPASASNKKTNNKYPFINGAFPSTAIPQPFNINGNSNIPSFGANVGFSSHQGNQNNNYHEQSYPDVTNQGDYSTVTNTPTTYNEYDATRPGINTFTQPPLVHNHIPASNYPLENEVSVENRNQVPFSPISFNPGHGEVSVNVPEIGNRNQEHPVQHNIQHEHTKGGFNLEKGVNEAREQLENTLKQEWSDFTTRFNKVYRSQEEADFRREVFFENRAKIQRFNTDYAEGRRNYVHRINPYADLLLHEFNNQHCGFNRTRNTMPKKSTKMATAFVPSANVVFPESVDWREVGAVGEVKTQGKCAACWAFAAAGALEGHHFRKIGKLVDISVQNLIDCTEPYGNNGCSGGLMDPAFEYVRENNGVDSEQSYPFEERTAECRFKKEDVVATCTGFVDIGENDEKGLEIALATLGPVTAAIDAAKETFQFYSDGIYDDPECGNKPEQMNHAVLIVGYGSDPDGRKYWLVKNSYGPQWGTGGYIKIAKENNNQCGIAIQASYPLV